MESLIWFSMPGAMLVTTIAFIWPSTVSDASRVALIAVATPLIGFVLHQAFRGLFEATGRFSRRSRRSIDEIIALARESQFSCTRDEAFLIWEATFYDTGIPAPFRDHNRGAWHYVLSFWGMAFSCGVSLVVIVIASYLLKTESAYLVYIAGGQLLVGGVFLVKAKQTYAALVDEECTMIRFKREVVQNTIDKLHAGPSKT